MKRALLLLAAVGLAGCPAVTPQPSPIPPPTTTSTTLVSSPQPSSSPIPTFAWDCNNPPDTFGLVRKEHRRGDRHMVVFRERPGFVRNSSNDVAAFGRVIGARDVKSLGRAVEGFSAKLEPAVFSRLVKDPMVWVEEEGEVKAVAVEWGLDRITQRSLPLDGIAAFTEDGSDVHIVVNDSGTNLNHQDFAGRLGESFSAVSGQGVGDQLGHGTHVMATAGGTQYGVAKKATLHAGRSLDANGSGSDSDVIAVLDWAIGLKIDNPTWKMVLNMSLGGDPSPAFDSATCRVIAAGITVVVAAGNESLAAHTSSPARVYQAITVGASDCNDRIANFSNYGPILDIYGPGVDVRSAWIGSATATNTISGTSMASPHIAGIAALILQRFPLISPAQVEYQLVNLSTKDRLSGVFGSSPNKIGYALAN